MEKHSVADIFNKIKSKCLYNEIELKENQMRVIDNLMKKKHCAGIFPTGYGKSLCFQLFPLLMDDLSPESKHICLVVSPLKSLMLDQCRSNKAHNIKFATILAGDTKEKEFIEDIKSGKFSILYASPEVLTIPFWKDIIIESPLYRQSVCLIAVDEAHVLETWGENFRPTMRNICELRSHFPTVPFLLLTATCTKKVLRKITDQLHLPDLCIETFSPDRPNIYLHWNLKCQNDPVEELSWLLDELRTEGREMKKTLIYVRSISKAATLFRDAIGSLRDDAYLNNIKSFENSLVALYHAGLNQEEQEHVLQELPKSDSIIRIVICTVAFGMGVNITDIRYVIHWGACDTIMEYWQEVGRAGRDGKDADAISYITPSSKIHVSDEMKQLVKDIALPNTCIRKSVLSAFIGVAPAQDLSCLCRCCSNCRNQCVHE